MLFSHIPKILHYCWFGSSPSTEFIDSWKEFAAGYKLMLWDDKTLDLSVTYLRNAFYHQKYANLSNYMRLWAVHEYGGIYLDTDVKLIRNIDALRKHRCFFGYQKKGDKLEAINNAVFGASKGHWFIKKAIHDIQEKFAGIESAALSSPVLISEMINNIGNKKEVNGIDYFNDIAVLPEEYFYPYFWNEKFSNDRITKNTYAIHYWEKRWS